MTAVDRPGSVACLVLAHGDPQHARRLRAALQPFDVFLHCDRRTDDATAAALVEDLPPTRVVTPRYACAWGAIGLVEAELQGYRQFLEHSSAAHLVVMSGADYPLCSTADIAAFLAEVGERSVADFWPLPFAAWGRSGGLQRLRYRHWAWRKHMIRLPLPRRLPDGVVPSGASVWKILSRRHVEAVLAAVRQRPDLLEFWRRSWSADETFVPTLLRSPVTDVDWEAESVRGEAWWIGWDGKPRKSPPWLDDDYFDRLAAGAAGEGRPVPALFARKVSTTRTPGLLDRIDTELRSAPVVAP